MNQPSKNPSSSPVETVITKTVAEVLEWTREGSKSRLYLPNIQRSVVWRNNQIINYWDSLLRGYPAGLMMVHRPLASRLRARNTEGAVSEIRECDFQLFDGQQRLTALLLGLGEGQLKDRLKLWIDFGMESPQDSDFRFSLRISSTGQPFGYRLNSPNEKYSLGERSTHATEWFKSHGGVQLSQNEAFAKVTGNDLIGSDCAVSLPDVVRVFRSTSGDQQAAVSALLARLPEANAEFVAAFIEALDKLYKSTILFQIIGSFVVEDEKEYIRFFGRLGQGGTPLSNDELTYSIIKHHFPEVHDRMKEITSGRAGRITSEVNLVLAALRLAKVLAPWDESGSWQIFGRPTPEFVSKLRDAFPGVRKEFCKLIPATAVGELKKHLESIRDQLTYHQKKNPGGLPVLMLSRLPRQLIEVLLLVESQQPTAKPVPLPQTVLYWLLFVVDSEKAANAVFRRFSLRREDWQLDDQQRLIRDLEEQGIAMPLPTREMLQLAKEEIQSGTHILRGWPERFAAMSPESEHPANEALKQLASNRERIRCALLWLQREYLSGCFSDYDPTSNRDEDLPIDLDHLVPQSKFSFHWKKRKKQLGFEPEDENFRWRRGLIGNSMGNFRWLDASGNRRRKDGVIDPAEAERDFIDQIDDWNAIIDKDAWEHEDVAKFQKLIDIRTISIFETLLNEGGLGRFIPNT